MNTLQDGPIDGVVMKPLKVFGDARGWLIEVFRNDELPRENWPVMAYISETLPGVARGPHEHVDQDDFFAFIGPGDLTLYCWDARAGSATFGRRLKVVVGQSNPVSVIVPRGVVHAYKNTGDVPAWAFNAANRLYAGEGKRQPVDEIRHESRPDNPYHLD